MSDAASAAVPERKGRCSRVFSRRALTPATLSCYGLRGQIHYGGPDPELSAAGHTQPTPRQGAPLRLLAGKRSAAANSGSLL